MFVDVFGIRTLGNVAGNVYSLMYTFEERFKQNPDIDKPQEFLVKISDIIRIQHFPVNGETFYVVIIGNQFTTGNCENGSILCLIVDEMEYVNLKQYLKESK